MAVKVTFWVGCAKGNLRSIVCKEIAKTVGYVSKEVVTEGSLRFVKAVCRQKYLSEMTIGKGISELSLFELPRNDAPFSNIVRCSGGLTCLSRLYDSFNASFALCPALNLYDFPLVLLSNNTYAYFVSWYVILLSFTLLPRPFKLSQAYCIPGR